MNFSSTEGYLDVSSLLMFVMFRNQLYLRNAQNYNVP